MVGEPRREGEHLGLIKQWSDVMKLHFKPYGYGLIFMSAYDLYFMKYFYKHDMAIIEMICTPSDSPMMKNIWISKGPNITRTSFSLRQQNQTLLYQCRSDQNVFSG
jgi:hypothetical protein